MTAVIFGSLFIVIPALVLWALHASEERARQKSLASCRPRLTTLLDELAEALRSDKDSLPDIIWINQREISYVAESRLLVVRPPPHQYYLVAKSYADGDQCVQLVYERPGLTEHLSTPFLKPKDRLRHAWLFERLAQIAEIAGETQWKHSAFTPAAETVAPLATPDR